MRSTFAVALMVTVLFAGGYFYYVAAMVCPVPVYYRIGQLDEQFGLSEEAAKAAVNEATEVWEKATGEDLFVYDEEANFTINFIFDERQATREAEEEFRERLDASQNLNEALGATYQQLLDEYDELKISYEERQRQYEERLTSYNDTVRGYNTNGGAPADVYAALEDERVALERERIALNDVAGELDTLVAKLNDLGQRGNTLISSYNQNVGAFNQTFGQPREFTQGEYVGNAINIYTFKDKSELKVVLAHEFGHALSIDHVENASSIMYYLIGEQPADASLGAADLAEFNRICREMSLWDKIVYRLSSN